MSKYTCESVYHKSIHPYERMNEMYSVDFLSKINVQMYEEMNEFNGFNGEITLLVKSSATRM